MIPKKCQKCNGHKIVGRFHYCDMRCGRRENSGHPLSPCRNKDKDCFIEEEGDYYCHIDEISIMEGNRCAEYCHWLQEMHNIADGTSKIIKKSDCKSSEVD